MNEQKSKPHIFFSAVFSAIIVVLFITVVTIVGELYAPLKDWLKATFTHHWVGKGVLSVVIFIVSFLVGLLPSKKISESRLAFFGYALGIIALLASFVLFGFFTYEFFTRH